MGAESFPSSNGLMEVEGTKVTKKKVFQETIACQFMCWSWFSLWGDVWTTKNYSDGVGWGVITVRAAITRTGAFTDVANNIYFSSAAIGFPSALDASPTFSLRWLSAFPQPIISRTRDSAVRHASILSSRTSSTHKSSCRSSFCCAKSYPRHATPWSYFLNTLFPIIRTSKINTWSRRDLCFPLKETTSIWWVPWSPLGFSVSVRKVFIVATTVM